MQQLRLARAKFDEDEELDIRAGIFTDSGTSSSTGIGGVWADAIVFYLLNTGDDDKAPTVLVDTPNGQVQVPDWLSIPDGQEPPTFYSYDPDDSDPKAIAYSSTTPAGGQWFMWWGPPFK